MAKTMRSVRLPTGLDNRLTDMAQVYDCTVSALICDALRRALPTYQTIPFYPVRTGNQLRQLTAAIKRNAELFKEEIKNGN